MGIILGAMATIIKDAVQCNRDRNRLVPDRGAGIDEGSQHIRIQMSRTGEVRAVWGTAGRGRQFQFPCSKWNSRGLMSERVATGTTRLEDWSSESGCIRI
jgi:hypothetical protein